MTTSENLSSGLLTKQNRRCHKQARNLCLNLPGKTNFEATKSSDWGVEQIVANYLLEFF